MYFFRDGAYVLRVLQESYAQSLALALSKLRANVVQYFFVLRAQNNSRNGLSRQHAIDQVLSNERNILLQY